MTETVTIDRRLSPSRSLDRDPESPRPSTRRPWRCTLIAAGPTSVRTKAMPVILTTDEEHDVWMRRGMRRRSYSGRCRMMR